MLLMLLEVTGYTLNEDTVLVIRILFMVFVLAQHKCILHCLFDKCSLDLRIMRSKHFAYSHAQDWFKKKEGPGNQSWQHGFCACLYQQQDIALLPN